MGYRGKTTERAKARELRAQNMTLADIAAELGVATSSVSAWVRDVSFTPSPRRYGPRVRPNALMQRKQAEIDELLAQGRARIAELSEREFLVAGAALYAGEGGKTDGSVNFVNSDPRIVALFLAWLRHFFVIDEDRLKLRVYLHEDLDLGAASRYWADVCGIPVERHNKAIRPKAAAVRKAVRHEMGLVRLDYSCSRTHREVMGLVSALLTCDLLPG